MNLSPMNKTSHNNNNNPPSNNSSRSISSDNNNDNNNNLNIPNKKRKPNRDLSNLLIDSQVGSGMYGTVFKAIEKGSGKVVALKSIKMSKESEGFPVTAVREIKLLKSMNHENIIRLHEIITYSHSQSQGGNESFRFDDGAVFMVFEYMDFDLSGLLTSSKMNWTSNHAQCYAKQMLSGLSYMHQHNILHRDIKGANILVNRDNRVKIADWGLARSFHSKLQKLTNNVVTIWYRCPELLLESKFYSTEIDIWAFGCLFGEMFGKRQPILPSRPPTTANQLELIYQLCGTPTGETEERLKKCEGWDKYHTSNVYEPKLREKFEILPPNAIDLLEKLLCLHPDQRITAEQALNHSYFSDNVTSNPDRLPRIPISIEEIHEYDIQKKKTEDESLKRSHHETQQSGHQQNSQQLSNQLSHNQHHQHHHHHHHHQHHNNNYTQNNNNNQYQRSGPSSSTSSSQPNISNPISGTVLGRINSIPHGVNNDPRMRSRNSLTSNKPPSDFNSNSHQSNRKSF